MPRQPLVTRTFFVTIASVKFIRTESGEVFDDEVILTKPYKNNNEILRAINNDLKKFEKPKPLKGIHVNSTRTETRLYGMKETDFIKHAVLMKDRKQKI